MVKNLRVTVDGDTHAVDSVEEAANLSEEAAGEDDEVAIHVRYTGRSGLRRSKIPTSTTRPTTTGSGVRYGNWATS